MTISQRLFHLTFQTYPQAKKPWRITESFSTSDGIRSRLTGHVFAFQEEAMEKIKELEGKSS